MECLDVTGDPIFIGFHRLSHTRLAGVCLLVSDVSCIHYGLQHLQTVKFYGQKTSLRTLF